MNAESDVTVSRRCAVVDDAGRPFEPWTLDAAEGSDAARPEVQMLQLRLSEALRGNAVLMGASAGVMLGVTWFVLAPLVGTFVAWLLIVLCGLPAFSSVLRRRMRRRGQQVAEVLVAHGLCGSCTYALSDLPTDGGRMTCPECGAAWKRERVTTFLGPIRWRGANPLERAGTEYESDGNQKWHDDRWAPALMARRRDLIDVAADLRRRERLETARQRLEATGRRLSLPVRIFGLLAGSIPLLYLLIVSLTQSQWPPAGINDWGAVLATVAIGFFIAWSMWRTNRHLTRRWAGVPRRTVRAALLAENLCPACASDLPADGGAFTRCSRCASSWRSADIGRLDWKAGPLKPGDAFRLLRLEWAERNLDKKTVKDDREVARPVMSPLGLRLAASDAQSEGLRGRTLEARARVAANGRALRWACGGLFLLIALLLGGSAVTALTLARGAAPPWVSLGAVMGIAMMLALAVAILTSDFARSSAKVRRDLVGLRVCPRCAADLEQLMPDGSDGCKVCPDCGGAWRLEHHATVVAPGDGC